MLLYAISDGTGSSALPERAANWAAGGVDFIQIREKQLAPRELLRLAAAIVEGVRATGAATRVLLNGPVEIALAAGADGVHLPGLRREEAGELRRDFPEMLVSIACHSVEEAAIARSQGASMALFAPVFGKSVPEGTLAGSGLHALAQACAAAEPMPIMALGEITTANARSCVHAGAAGVAGIRLFAGEDWRELL